MTVTPNAATAEKEGHSGDSFSALLDRIDNDDYLIQVISDE